MARSSVKYQFISDASARKVTLKKRKASMVKKISELATLCDVDACLVMYDNEDSPPEVWPSESEARRVIERFQKTKVLGTKTIQDHDVFLERKIGKMERQLEKEKEKCAKNLMVKCLVDKNVIKETNPEDLEGLKKLVDSEIKWLNYKMKEACEKLKEDDLISL